MKRASLPLLLAALAAATPAAAQQEEWGRRNNLVVYRDAAGCTSSGAMADGTVVEVREQIGGAVTLRVARKGWRFAPGRSYPIRMVGAGAAGTVVADANATGFRDSKGRRGFAIPVAASDLTISSGVAAIDIFEGTRLKPFATIPPPSDADFLRYRCVAALTRTDRGSGKPAATPARPRGKVANFVTNDDYPAAALRAGEQGVSMLRVIVSAKGQVTACNTYRSSGSDTLDNTACSLMARRARYTPALDADGQPTEDEFLMPFDWKLPAN